ncbi:MAG: 3-deoxy-7-phosphoheptulonate synthase [Elusimicrobia bacterium]|nr:3-deoxy-7-phosphoheptulonate synthase [Elusimicrobiota bacterium]
MILTLKSGVSKKGIDDVVRQIKKLKLKAHLSQGTEKVIIGVIGPNAAIHREIFEGLEAIEAITAISKPYKLVSREFKKSDTIFNVRGVKIGGPAITLIAGPCSVDKKESLFEIANAVKQAGAQILRGGAFKPRTSPYQFQGHGYKALRWLQQTRQMTRLPIITEVMDPRHVSTVARYADILQIGARNAQNFFLLKEVGKAKKPVMLKRGMAMTIEEWLLAAEYIAAHGNHEIIMCERGIRTYETATRFTLDLNAVPLLKQLTHLPVFVDPSHGVGVRELIPAMARAAVAAGADGLIVEVHRSPTEALSDGHQALLPAQFAQMVGELRKVAAALGRTL